MGERYLCPNCWFVGKPNKHLRGSPALELVLWLLFIIPGALYAWWRHREPRLACDRCGSLLIVPEDSPGAMTLRATIPVALSESLGSIERAARLLFAIPLTGGVAIVVLFVLSASFPGVRNQTWFYAAFALAAVAVIAHPLWTFLHFVLWLVKRLRPRR